ncbi:MAG: hypothetical protein N4A63_09705 [Vallitalea sp.]|jgi:hypothetical protein|nr:hypothetical protein [Vallitalea sp.]MCT4597695.1 hypothetical protein [Vallitalea sp.]
MGSILEVTMYYNEILLFDEIIKQIDFKNYKIDIKNIEILDDWEYTNHQVLYYSNSKLDIEKIVLENKIIIINFTVNNFICGYHISKINQDTYESCIWLNTYGLDFLDIDRITNKNKFFYDVMTKKIINSINSNKLLFIGIGIEPLIEYNKDFQIVINKSKNIIKWILPQKKSVVINNYSKKIINKFSIYTLKNNLKE